MRKRWMPLAAVTAAVLVLVIYFAGYLTGVAVRPPDNNAPAPVFYGQPGLLATTPEGCKIYRVRITGSRDCVLVVDPDGHTVRVEFN
jgi:hypothetical protein